MNVAKAVNPSDNPPRRRRRGTRPHPWLVGLVAFVLTVALFYAEEDWRGKRAWLRYERELEAQGKVLAWSRYIPPAVPDDQNIFKAPQMRWLVKNGATNALSELFHQNDDAVQRHLPRQVVVAQIRLVRRDATSLPDREAAPLGLDEPADRVRLRAAIEGSVGPWALGARQIALVARPLDQLHPIHLAIHSTRPWTSAELATVLPGFQVRAASSNTFVVSLGPAFAAQDYLATTEALEPGFATIGRALQRPYARTDSDYQRPIEATVPNFVAIRSLVQTLAQRAECFLLAGQPSRALGELDRLQALRRLLEPPAAWLYPAGEIVTSPPTPRHPAPPPTTERPMTLVSAMIDVAVNGLYVSVIQDGLRLGAWGEPELAALAGRLPTIALVPEVTAALNTEVAAVVQSVQTTRWADLFGPSDPPRHGWGRWLPRISLVDLLPRGWLYQNVLVYGRLMEQQINSLEASRPLIEPHQVEAAWQATEQAVSPPGGRSHLSPYNLLAAVAIPNAMRAYQTTARNQTTLNQAIIACALERYRLAHGEYPVTLEALVPGYLRGIPPDLIGGQPPRYRRTAEGQFLLYSTGWSEQDHGGRVLTDPLQGDWVWTTTVAR